MKTRIAENRTVGLIFMIPLYIACTGVASAQTRNDTLSQMRDLTVHLKEVQVSASRPLIKAELDRITYHVADDPEWQEHDAVGNAAEGAYGYGRGE